MEHGNLFPSIPAVLEQHPDADKDYVQAFFKALELPQVAQWDMEHPCKSVVNRAFVDVWDLVNLGQIGRDEIQAKLNEYVEPAQAALDECRGRLGG
jgi:hypothetical protein